MIDRRIFGWVIAAVLAVLTVSVYVAAPPGRVMERGSLKIGGIAIEVDVARSAAERERGLSGRPSLADGQGMLFVFPKPGRYAFWMKDMRFPIDIVWLRRGAIAAIAHEVPPPAWGRQPETRMPEVEVDAVLEVPAGYAATHGFGPGMPVEMPL